MPFDALALAAVSDEVQQSIGDGRVQKIVQPSEHSVALQIYSGNREWLLLSADTSHARIQLSDQRYGKAFDSPGGFLMQLRKHLDGARLVDCGQLPGERVFVLTFKGDRVYSLISEIMGKHSNIILVDDRDVVLGAVKVIPSRLSRLRPILPGRPYRPPPKQERAAIYPAGPRVDPHLLPSSLPPLLKALPPGTLLHEALLGLLEGCSPFLAREIIRRTGLDVAISVDQADLRAVRDAADGLYSLYQSRAWEPNVFGEDRLDFAPYRPTALGARTAPSMSAAIEICLGSREARDGLAAGRNALVARIEREKQSQARRIASLQRGLDATRRADDVLEEGQLLVGFQHLPRANDRLEIPELGRSISLVPELTVQANAERRFHRYRKLKEAATRVPPLIRESEIELARLEDLEAFARLAETERDLRDLDRQTAGTLPEAKQKRAPQRRQPVRLALNGAIALVGRNARENEEITFKNAERGDLWLHARNRTGAHVVLRTTDSPDEHIIMQAASLAAYHSEARSEGAVDVDVTEVRNVRKLRGGAPGRVTYREFRTLRVKPEIGAWEPSRASGAKT
ncbi:MAG: Rqc2 family fibronectin-binding protein [Chloroflexota bacterium]